MVGDLVTEFGERFAIFGELWAMNTGEAIDDDRIFAALNHGARDWRRLESLILKELEEARAARKVGAA